MKNMKWKPHIIGNKSLQMWCFVAFCNLRNRRLYLFLITWNRQIAMFYVLKHNFVRALKQVKCVWLQNIYIVWLWKRLHKPFLYKKMQKVTKCQIECTFMDRRKGSNIFSLCLVQNLDNKLMKNVWENKTNHPISSNSHIGIPEHSCLKHLEQSPYFNSSRCYAWKWQSSTF